MQEARPSPERLDAQLRHLVLSYGSGLQSVIEEIREIKTELRDLKLIIQSSLTEFKAWNEQAADTHSKGTAAAAAAAAAAGEIKPDDFFEFPNEEDFADDINQLTQQYANYPK